jgi:hypothetical protein
MAVEADYGLMLWDGESRGTLTSIVDLVRQGKPVLVYLAPDRSFLTLKEPEDLAQLRGQLDSTALLRVDRELQLLTHPTVRVSGRERETSSMF